MKNTLNRQLDNQEPYISAESDNGPLAIATIRIGLRESLANARLIVRAVNAHDELLAACKRLTREVGGMVTHYESGLRELMSNTNYAVLKQGVKEAEAAIARAEAE